MNKIIQQFTALFLFLLTLQPVFTIAAPFQNGSFEEDSSLFDGPSAPSYDNLDNTESNDVSHWDITILEGVEAVWSATLRTTPQDGNYFVIPCGGNPAGKSRWGQTFDTIANKIYEVNFYGYRGPSASGNGQKIRFNIKDNNENGTAILTEHDVTMLSESWQQYSFSFTALSNQTYLSFEGLVVEFTSLCSYIDNITVTLLPSPAWSNSTASYPNDPGHAKTKSIPGQDMVIDQTLMNTGASPGADSVAIKLSVANELAFRIGSVVCEDARRTLTYAEGYGLWQPSENFTTTGVTSSGLTAPCSSIEYSTVGKDGPWGYTPAMDFMANENWDESGGLYSYDNDVRGIKINTTGTFADGTSGDTPVYRAYFYAKIK